LQSRKQYTKSTELETLQTFGSSDNWPREVPNKRFTLARGNNVVIRTQQ